MKCPACKSKDVRRSRRQNSADYVLSAFGIYPWRCRICEARYHARIMSLNDSLHAHCPICGNHDLKRISADRVDRAFSFLWRRLAIPAYRCEPCRHKYFSVLPYRHEDNEVPEMTSAD